MEKRGESTEVGMHAVLVGCNYPNTGNNSLTGCDNDVHMMRKTLIERFCFDPKRIVVMTDNPGSKHKPTGENIKKELMKMVNKARRGDRLFFHFAGHGLCSKNEHAIVACDDNLITHMDLRDLVNRLPENATFTVFADSCCSGGLIDKEPVQVGLPYHKLNDDDQTMVTSHDPHLRMITYESYLARLSSRTGIDDPNIGVHLIHLFRSEASILFQLPPQQHPKPLKSDQGILLSGSEPHKSSYGDEDENGAPCGAFTKTVVEILKRHPAVITNKQLVMKARDILGNKKKEPQFPCLYCSRKNADAVFLGKASSARAGIGGETSSHDGETEHASD